MINRAPSVRPDPDEALGGYLIWLERTGRSPATKKAYADRARMFVEWLQEHADRYTSALHDEDVRDYAARDYRSELIERRLAPATVAQRMAAVGDLYRWPRVGAPRVPATVPADPEAKALTEEEMKAVLRA